jgi:uncharacterized repeat protein (TIGR01451 family)
VAALASVVAVAAGDAHSLAARNDGTVWAWGSNRYGQLGDGTTAQRSAPVPVGGVSGVVSIAAGGNHSLAVSGDGTVWAWGYNYYGQVGDGAAGIELLPVPVVPPGSPDIVISKTHAGSFSIGIPASYAITLTNVGQTATSGTLTVIDTLPVGLNFSSASGTNWTCGAAGRAITCTSPASIDPGSSSTITLNPVTRTRRTIPPAIRSMSPARAAPTPSLLSRPACPSPAAPSASRSRPIRPAPGRSPPCRPGSR